MPKTEKIAAQRKYLEDKLQKVKWKGRLTPVQIQELRAGIEAGNFLEKHVIKQVFRDSNAPVRDAVHDAAKGADAARDLADREQRIEALQPEIQEALKLVRVWANEAPKHIDMVKGIATQIEKLAEYEFMKVSSSGGRVLESAVELREAAQELIDHDVYKVLKTAYRDIQAAEQAKNADKLERLVARLPDDARALAPKYYKLGVTGKKAVDAAITQMDEKAIKAWCEQNPSTAAKMLDLALDVVGAGLDVAEEAMSDSPAKQFTPILSAFKVLYEVVIQRQIMAAQVHHDVRKNQAKHVKGHGFDLADEDTTLIAKEVARQQKANFDAALSAISFLAAEIPGWSIIRVVIKQAGHKYYDERVRLARKAAREAGLAAPKKKTFEEKWEQVQNNAFESLAETALTELPDLLVTAATEGIQKAVAGGFSALQDMAIESTIGAIMRELMKHLPVEQGQLVDGATLRGDVAGLLGEVTIRRYGQSEEVADVGQAKIECPKEDKDGRPVEKIMQSMSEQDSTGRYFWVKIEGKVGKLYVDGKAFKAISGASLTFPEEDDRGRKIDEILAKYADRDGRVGSYLEVRMGDLVGVYYDDKRFEPKRPATVVDWSARTVDIGNYKEGATTVNGTWFRCSDNPQLLFFEHGDKREWALNTSRTASGFTVHEMFRRSKLGEKALAEMEPVR